MSFALATTTKSKIALDVSMMDRVWNTERIIVIVDEGLRPSNTNAFLRSKTDGNREIMQAGRRVETSQT